MTTVVSNREPPFSSTLNHAIEEYSANIGFLTKTYQEIESAKGRWDVRRVEYSQKRWPPTDDELYKTLDTELNTYVDFVNASEKSEALFTLFRDTISFCSRENIASYDYNTLEKLGYQITDAKAGEKLLPDIRAKLEILSARIETIKDHMIVRLPTAAKNLNSVFQTVAYAKNEVTWGDTGTNLIAPAYLNKALAKRAASTMEEPKKKESLAIMQTPTSIKTYPEKEIDMLQNIFKTLDKLSQEDTLSSQQPQKTIPYTKVLDKAIIDDSVPSSSSLSASVLRKPLSPITTPIVQQKPLMEIMLDGGKKKGVQHPKN